MQFCSTPVIRTPEGIHRRAIIPITKHPPPRAPQLAVFFYSIYHAPFSAQLHTDTTDSQTATQFVSTPRERHLPFQREAKPLFPRQLPLLQHSLFGTRIPHGTATLLFFYNGQAMRTASSIRSSAKTP